MASPEIASFAFGLLSAASWGAGDFCGGLASRRANPYAVVIVAEAMGAVAMAIVALSLAEALPPSADLAWGAAAGIAGAIGILALYRGLATGRMGVVAPVSAVLAAALPVIVGAVMEGVPGAPQMTGFGMAALSVWWLSRPQTADIRANDLGLPLIAGVGFGLFFVLIDQASGTSAFWPLVAARSAALVMIVLVALATRQPLRPPADQRSALVLMGTAGVLDAAGNAFFVLAARLGRLDVASVLASLYPACTVGLAWLILKERLTRVQWLGVIAALLAIMLIAL